MCKDTTVLASKENEAYSSFDVYFGLKLQAVRQMVENVSSSGVLTWNDPAMWIDNNNNNINNKKRKNESTLNSSNCL